MSAWGWWQDLWNESAAAPDLPPMPGAPSVQRVRVRERREVDGKVVSERSVQVSVKHGHVSIDGDVLSLTINGRRVRFREPA